MSFSQSTITSVNPPVQHGTQLLLSWTSSAPGGTLYQVYLNQQLVWSGVGLSCSIPLPTAISRIDIGTVGSAESQADFAAELPPTPARQATLSWLGGTYQGADIAGFHIYGEYTPGGGIDDTTILATVPTYVAAIITDGFGYGGFGQGGFGHRPARTLGPRSRSRGAPGTGVSNRSTPPATRGPRRSPPSRSPRRRCRRPRSRT